mgnify:CR=1 FL=1
MFWVALGMLPRPQHQGGDAVCRLSPYSRGVSAWIFIMVLSDGFVTGLKAGPACNTFPTMNGHWLPPDLYALHPLWHSFFDSAAQVIPHGGLIL